MQSATAATTTTAATTVQQLLDRGEVDAAVRVAQQALPTLDGEARGQMQLLLSSAHLSAGQALAALRAGVAAGDTFKACGSRGGACDALVRVSQTLRVAGDQASAVDTLEQAETLARALGDPVRTGTVLRNMGVSCSIIGRHQHALSCLNEALALQQQHGSLGEVLNTRLSLYNAHDRQSDSAPAGSADLQTAASLLRWQTLADECAAGGHTRLEVMARGNHAIRLIECGRAAEAAAELQHLLHRYRALGMRPNEAASHTELGRCHEALNQPEQARDQYQRVVELLQGEGSLDERQQALEGLSRTEEALGRLAPALAALREARALDKRKSDDAARNTVAQRELRIELSQLSSQWAQQAAQDPLTGLGNRRALERWLDEHLPGVERGQVFSLMLMDLDHFKQVNDQHGHDVGDEVLRQVAALIRSHCRSHDLAVRYGGEEFLLALAQVPLAEAAEVAERLRQSVASQPWGRVRPGLVVSLSIGITQTTEAPGAAGLLTLADQRLYTAKLAGRNRVVTV